MVSSSFLKAKICHLEVFRGLLPKSKKLCASQTRVRQNKILPRQNNWKKKPLTTLKAFCFIYDKEFSRPADNLKKKKKKRHTSQENLSVSPPQRMMAATNRARSLSSSSRALNLTANSNLGSMISLKGFLKLRRNSLVTKPLPLATNRPSLFMREGNMAKIASCTPYFSKVTCRKHTDKCSIIWKSNTQIILLCSTLSRQWLTWSLRKRSTNPGMHLANSVSSRTVSTVVHWQR